MIYQTMTFSGNDVWDVEGALGDTEDVKGMAVMVLLIFSVLGLLFGIMGTAVICCKNRLYAICLTILLLFVWMAMLIIGFVLTAASRGAATLTDALCQAVAEQQSQDAAELEAGALTAGDETGETAEAGDAGDAGEAGETDGTETVETPEGDGTETAETDETTDDGTVDDGEDELTFEEQIELAQQDAEDRAVEGFAYLNAPELNTFMCSKYCPCPDVGDKLIEWIGLSRSEVLTRNRIAKWNDGVTPEPWVFGGLTYQVKGDMMDETPVGVEDQYIYPKTYNNFSECIDDAITREDGEQLLDPEFIALAESFQPGGSNEYVKTGAAWVEESYDCSGSCTANLFYFTQDVSAGVPTQACVQPIVDDFSGIFSSVGMAGVVSGLLLFCSFFWSYCLWKKYED